MVAGVGDSPRTDAAERVTNGLTKWAGFAPPEEHSDWFLVTAQDDPKTPALQPVQRFATASPDGTPTDVYEFWWADLSRFPAAMRSFLAAFVGLFLAFPSMGRTALRDTTTPVTYDFQKSPTKFWPRPDFHLLGLVSWLTAVPIIVLSAVVLLAVGAASASSVLPNDNTGAAGLALYGLVVGGVEIGFLRRYQQKSGREPVVLMGVLTLLAAAGICGWRLYERGTGSNHVDIALADTVTVLVTYPLRVLWLGLVLVAALTIGALGFRLWRAGGKRETRRHQTVTALITLGVGPLGLAFLMAVMSAAVGAAVEKPSKLVKWDNPAPICLTKPWHWRWDSCDHGTTAWAFGVLHLEDAIFALVCASIVTGAIFLVLGLAASYRFLHVPFRNRTDVARIRDQARAISHALAEIDSGWACALMIVGGLAAAYFAASAWLDFGPFWLPSWIRGKAVTTPIVAAVLGGSVTTVLVASRLIGVTPTSLATDGAVPGVLRAILDKPYDISTFLREPSGTKLFGIHFGLRPTAQTKLPRQKMLDRYRALMRFLTDRDESEKYSRIVFVAHSQGTILTTTLLAEPPKTAPLPGEVSLMTFGCPLRQLYMARFPSEWSWVHGLESPATRERFVSAVNREWVNVAMSGDPIGRTVFDDPPPVWPGRAETKTFERGTPAIEELLLGPGGHSAYWPQPKLYERLRRLIDA